MIAVFPTGAAGVLAVAIGVGFFVLFELLCRRRRTLRTWTIDGLVAAAIMVLIALVPLRAHATIARLGLGFIVFTLFLAVVVVIGSRFTIGSYRRRLGRRTTATPPPPEVVPIPPASSPIRDAIVGLGFREVTTVRFPDGSTITFLLRERDHVVAEVAAFPPPNDDAPVIELSSLLSGLRGVLATSTFGLGTQLWAGEFRQVFPGAPAAHLVDSHEVAARFLGEHGIHVDPITADQLLPLRQRMIASREGGDVGPLEGAEEGAGADRPTPTQTCGDARGAEGHPRADRRVLEPRGRNRPPR